MSGYRRRHVPTVLKVRALVRIVSFGLVPLLGAAGAVAVSPVTAASAAPVCAGAAADEQAAMDLAKACDREVDVLAATTELTRKTVARTAATVAIRMRISWPSPGSR